MLTRQKLREANSRMVARAPEDLMDESQADDLGLPPPESKDGRAVAQYAQEAGVKCFRRAVEAGLSPETALMHVWIDGATSGYEAGVVEPQREESESAK